VCTPPTLSAYSNYSSVPAKVNEEAVEKEKLRAIDEDNLNLDNFRENNEPFSSSEDDSSHGTATRRPSLNNDSDCETIVTSSSKSANCNDYSVSLSVCSSDSESITRSKSRKSMADRMNEVDPNDVDKLIVEELQELSVVDRNMVQEEIHGVSTCAVFENDAQIVESLKCLEEEIGKIRREILASPEQVSKAGYTYDESIWSYLAIDNETSSMSVSYLYISHRDFCLKFLRADLYDAEKASHRYLRCVEGLLKYFGSYALQRPLVFEDLGKECQDAAKHGYIQILPSRDRAGRLIVVSQAPKPGTSMATTMKLYTYIFQVVSEDIETQKKGVIFIFSSDESALSSISNFASKKEYSLYREGSPVRRSCTHFCLPEKNPKMRIFRAIMMLAMSSEERVRTRIHMDGFTTETNYDLLTFGIPVSELPITSTGVTKTKHHSQWIKTRKAIDASRMKSLEGCYSITKQRQEQYHSITSSQFLSFDFCTYPPTYDQFLKYHRQEPIIHPMVNDVLFSKGGKNITHFGNIEFTDLLKNALTEYVTITPLHSRKIRKAIRQSIMEKVRARGGRFLTLDKTLPGGYCWIEITNESGLHDRIATSLYDHRRRLAAKKKLKSIRCATGMFTGIDNSKRRKVVSDDGTSIPVPSCCEMKNV